MHSNCKMITDGLENKKQDKQGNWTKLVTKRTFKGHEIKLEVKQHSDIGK